MDNRKKLIILLVLFIFISFNVDIAFSYSRYVSKNVWNHFLSSKEFYFSSDVLNRDETLKINTMWDGGKTIFNISNNEGDKISKYDITYDVSCEVLGSEKNDFECLLNGTGKSTLTNTLSKYETCINETGDSEVVSDYTKSDCEMNNYVWDQQVSNMEYYFTIEPLGDVPLKDIKVEVKAKTTKPYKTTISKTFSYHASNVTNNNIKATFTSNLVFDRVLITNTFNKSKCISVSFDNQDYRIKTSEGFLETFSKNGYINQVNFNLDAKDNKVLEFQRRNKQIEGNINSFTISDC